MQHRPALCRLPPCRMPALRTLPQISSRPSRICVCACVGLREGRPIRPTPPSSEGQSLSPLECESGASPGCRLGFCSARKREKSDRPRDPPGRGLCPSFSRPRFPTRVCVCAFASGVANSESALAAARAGAVAYLE